MYSKESEINRILVVGRAAIRLITPIVLTVKDARSVSPIAHQDAIWRADDSTKTANQEIQMLRRLIYSMALASLVPSTVFAQDDVPRTIPTVEEVFTERAIDSDLSLTNFQIPRAMDVCAPVPASAGLQYDNIPCDADLCLPSSDGCDSISCADDGWLSCLCSDTPLLAGLKNQQMGCWTYSIGGEFRYRYLDERNRLRPPATGRYSSYHQTRFTPYLEVKYGDQFTGYVQAIDAHTFDNELIVLPIDENRADLLRAYADFKLMGDKQEQLRFKVGRQFLKYGSQHLVSPLGWSNTFRNFEGYKLYYSGPEFSIDAFATRPVNGAAGHIPKFMSFDSPDQSRWFSGVYATWKKAPRGTLDLYWLWLDEDQDLAFRLDGNRHTFGARYAGSMPYKDACGDPLFTWSWDWEGAFQTGQDIVGTGPIQDVKAGMFSAISGVTFNQLRWTPKIDGIFYWGSGDDDPTDGDQGTFNTLFPLGHAYWGILDNFSGQNLFDYGTQVTVKPTDKLTFVTAVHWFQKDQAEDAIWNIAGVPFGGFAPTDSRYLGNEVDLIATYSVNQNLTLQSGYSWFFYGQAVNGHPVTAVADRDDATQFYFFADWKF